MTKLKNMPNTKKQSKYFGSCTVSRVTDNHAIVSNQKVGSKREKKIPIDIVRPFYERGIVLSQHPSCKRKLENRVVRQARNLER